MLYAIVVFGPRPLGLPRYTRTEAAAHRAIQRAAERTPSACLRAGAQIRAVATVQRALSLDASSPYLPGEERIA